MSARDTEFVEKVRGGGKGTRFSIQLELLSVQRVVFCSVSNQTFRKVPYELFFSRVQAVFTEISAVCLVNLNIAGAFTLRFNGRNKDLF